MIREVEFKIDSPDKALKAIKPDIDKTNRFKASIKSSRDKLKLRVEAKDKSAMRAALNSYKRLIETIRGL